MKNCSFDTLANMLEAFGFVRRRRRSGSSHAVFIYAGQKLSIPFARPIKELYVRDALLTVDTLFGRNETADP